MQPDIQALALTKALRKKESGGNYNAVGDAGTSTGAYQYQAGTWKQYSKEILGSEAQMTPENQNAVTYGMVKKWKDSGLGPAEIAAKWNSGNEKGWENKIGTTTINGQAIQYNVPQYVSEVVSNFKQIYPQEQQKYTQQQPVQPQQETYGAMFPASPTDNPLVAGIKAVGNVPSSLFNFGKSIVQAVANPIDTVKGLGNVVIGGAEKLTGSQPTEATQTFDAFTQGLKERYGSLENLQRTATNDPFGFGSDVASVFAPVAKGFGVAEDVNALAQRVARPIAQPIENLGQRIGNIAKPFAGSVSEDITSAMARQGVVNAPASAITTSPFVRRLETIFSGENLAKKVDDFGAQINQVADNLLASVGETEDIATAGEKIAKGLTKFQEDYKKTTATLYDTFSKKGGSLMADANTTTDTLLDIIKSKEDIADTSNLKFFNDKLDVVTGSGEFKLPTFDTLKKVRTNIGEMLGAKFQDPFVKSNEAQLKRLYGALSTDMENTIKATGNKELTTAFDTANTFYKQGVEKLQTDLAKRIRRFSTKGQYDKVISSIIGKSTSVNELPAFLEVIGKENIPRLQQAVLDEVFTGAKNLEGVFTENGIAKMIDRIGEEKLKLILSPEQYANLTDLEKLTRAFQQAQKVAKGSQTAFLGKQMAELGLTGSAIGQLFTGNIAGFITTLSPILGDKIANAFISSKIGQQFLTNGIEISNAYTKAIGSGARKAVEVSKAINVPARMLDNSVASVNSVQENNNPK